MTTPSSMMTSLSPTSRAKPIPWVTTNIVIPGFARPRRAFCTPAQPIGGTDHVSELISTG